MPHQEEEEVRVGQASCPLSWLLKGFTPSESGVVTRSTELSGLTLVISHGVPKLSPARLGSLMLSIMLVTMNWLEPRLWSRTPSLSSMLLLSGSGTRPIMLSPWEERREPS